MSKAKQVIYWIATQFCKNRCVETKCGEFVVPEEHLTACSTCNSRGRECGLKEEEGEGVDDVDFLLYVSARDTKQCGGKIGEGNFHILSKAVRLPGLRAKVLIDSYQVKDRSGSP